MTALYLGDTVTVDFEKLYFNGDKISPILAQS